MILDFEKYAMKGNEFMHQLEENLSTLDRAHAGRILRSTFAVLRNHLMFQESLQLLSQLPMAIKAVYVDGWRAGSHTRIHSVDQFLVEIVQAEGNSAWRDFSSREDLISAVRAVIDTMRLYVSSEEMDQALKTLPAQIQEIFESSETDL